MKPYLILLLSCTYFLLAGQSYETVYELVEVQQEQTLYLNKLLKFSGKNRAYIQFQLPENTVYWMYAFGTAVNKPTTPKESGSGFKKALMDLINKGGQIAFSAVDALTKPSGVAAIDVHLTDYENAHHFMSKNEFGLWSYATPPRYYIDASRQNLTSGIITSQAKSQSPLCLTFKNPSPRQGVSISIEIYAYIEKKVYVDEWTTTSMNLLHNNCLSFFTHTNKDIQKVCGCVMEQIQAKYSPKDFIEASKERQELAFNQVKETCYTYTGTAHVEETDEQIKQLFKEITGLQEIKDYSQLVTKYEALIALGKKDASTYNGLAWNCLLSRQLDKAKQYLVAGLGENPNNLYLQGNLAHYYLITGDFEAAKTIYSKYKGEQLTEEIEWKDMVRTDLKIFEDLDIYHPDFNKARRVVGLPPGRLAQVFDKNYAVGEPVTFQRGNQSHIGLITALDKEKGENSIAYQNIYGEPKTARLSVLQVTPLTTLEYQEKLQAWQAEIAQYNYTLGEIGTWKKQQETLFGTIVQLNDQNHKATIKHQNIYGEMVQSNLPYLDIVIISPTEKEILDQEWQQTIQQYQFEVGAPVSWSTKNLLSGLITTEQGTILQLNSKSHTAHISFINSKGKEKVIKKGYLSLTKVRA